MARGHVDLPKRVARVAISKSNLYRALARIDLDPGARDRVLRMETAFRRKITTHIAGLPAADAKFDKFNTSPFVIMFHSHQQGYRHVSEVEGDIIPAKVFSSMETSAGRMVEEVVLPVYGWQVVPSQMHSIESVLDGRKSDCENFSCVTLKSGPRCLNDEMAKDIGLDVHAHAPAWARSRGVNEVEFTYGVLYGTKCKSNKKDWHILRNIAQAVEASGGRITQSHRGAWSLTYEQDGLRVNAAVRVGLEWWEHLGGPDAWVEVCVALVRACITPGPETPVARYAISDLAAILDLSGLPRDFNIALLQRSQLEWLLFLARHFCDDLVQ